MKLLPPLHPVSSSKRNPITLFLLLLFFLWTVPSAAADTTVGGAIAADTTWALAGSPYIVTSNITVKGTDGADGITTLTVEPGVEIRMNAYRQIIVGASSGDPGALVAQGTAADPIVFTSNDATPEAGDWYNITFYNTTNDASTILEHCVVEYSGYSQGALYLNNASPTIRNTQIRHSKNRGIYIATGAPVIDTCELSDNQGYDVYYSGTAGGPVSDCTLNSGIYLLATGTVDFSGNTINQNNAFPITTYADNVGDIVDGNTIANVDGSSYLQVNQGTISRDAVWNAQIPYYIYGNPTVRGTDGADGITTLTLSPGAQLKFNTYKQMVIGASSGDPGALVAQGTAADPIVFTSNAATPAAGDWYNIIFYTTTDDASTILEHCVVEYAGYSQGAIYLNNASPTIRNTQIRHSKNRGIYITTGEPVIDTCQLSDNQGYDVYYSGTVGGTVSDCTFNSGIYLVATGTVGFSGNTINQNNAFPITTYADNVGDIVDGNTIANVDGSSYLQVNQGTISRDAVWNAQIPYYMYGNPTVKGTDGADGITTLTLAPGAELRFNAYKQMIIGASSGDPGALVAQGTEADPIVFTSNAATPAAGDWYNIIFYTTTDDASTILEHCLVEYGGYSQGAIYLNNASIKVINTTIRHSKNAGIYGTGIGTGSAEINCNTFSSNKRGIHWTASPAPEMHNNNFAGNTEYGLYYSGAATLNAEDNWWGDVSGPNAGGDSTYGNVDADPWSAAEHDCSSSGENHPPHEPNTPDPADNAVRVSIDGGTTLSWSGGDPDILDTVTYDLYWGTESGSLVLTAQDFATPQHSMADLLPGITYYWQITAKDDHGLETTGPEWRFTTNGDPPDLVISSLNVDPAGNIQTGQSVTFIAVVQNNGSGPVVDAFSVAFHAGGASIGGETVDQILPAGQSIQVNQIWTYNGGDPVIEVIADDQGQVSETDESNNSFSDDFLAIADNSAPALVSTSPTDGAALQQIQQISATLADSQAAVDDAAVIASFTVTDSSMQSVTGSITESSDTFTFVPDTIPLADDTYQVGLTAIDTHGNSQSYSFNFTIDTQPPVKPGITGGQIESGTIQPRPAQNTTGQFVVELTGTREAGTNVWIDGAERVPFGDNDWAIQLSLSPGINALEVWLTDAAGNQGESEWVDIEMQSGTEINYEYNDSGRMTRVTNID
jgi:hypothetical protein